MPSTNMERVLRMSPLSLEWTGFIILAVAILAWATYSAKVRQSLHPWPPSPRGEPIIGHVRYVPFDRPELTFQRWSKELSE